MSVTDQLRTAIQTIRSNPSAAAAIEAQLDAADVAKVAAAEAAAKSRDVKLGKVQSGLEGRTADLMADFLALQAEAIRAAAEDLARQQLEMELGMVDPRIVTIQGAPRARLSADAVERSFEQLASRSPVPWDRDGRTPDLRRSAQQRAAHDAIASERAAAAAVDDVEERIAQQRARLESNRLRAIAERKAAAGIGAKS